MNCVRNMPKRSDSIEFKTTLEKAGNDSGWYFIRVSAKQAAAFDFDGKGRRVVCTLNGRVKYQCALMPSRGDFVIIVNKKNREILGAVEGSPLSVLLEMDTSKYGLPMPKEFKEVLRQDRDGDRLFHSLTAGKQRTLIYAVGNIKNIDRRIHNALIIIQHLKDNSGKIDFPKLGEELKRPLSDIV